MVLTQPHSWFTRCRPPSSIRIMFVVKVDALQQCKIFWQPPFVRTTWKLFSPAYIQSGCSNGTYSSAEARPLLQIADKRIRRRCRHSGCSATSSAESSWGIVLANLYQDIFDLFITYNGHKSHKTKTIGHKWFFVAGTNSLSFACVAPLCCRNSAWLLMSEYIFISQVCCLQPTV